MKKPTAYDWTFAFSMIANLILFWAIILMSSDKKPYDDYRECAKYTGTQTCFEQTIGGKSD